MYTKIYVFIYLSQKKNGFILNIRLKEEFEVENWKNRRSGEILEKKC
jgi:hypothetical protein